MSSGAGYIVLGAEGTGTTHITATRIQPGQSFTQIETVDDTDNGFALPNSYSYASSNGTVNATNQVVKLGEIYTVENVNANDANIYPAIAPSGLTGSGGQINTLSPNVPLLLGANTLVQFLSIGDNDWVTIPSVVQPVNRARTVIVDDDYKVEASESGSDYLINVQGANIDISLPEPDDGLVYVFYLATTAGTNDVIITATDNVMDGTLGSAHASLRTSLPMH